MVENYCVFIIIIDIILSKSKENLEDQDVICHPISSSPTAYFLVTFLSPISSFLDDVSSFSFLRSSPPSQTLLALVVFTIISSLSPSPVEQQWWSRAAAATSAVSEPRTVRLVGSQFSGIIKVSNCCLKLEHCKSLSNFLESLDLPLYFLDFFSLFVLEINWLN